MTWTPHPTPEELPVTWTPALRARHADLARRYDLKYFTIEWQGYAISFCAVENIDRLFDELLAKGDDHEDVKDERIPYWADVWPSALGLSRFLSEARPWQPGQRVLELGAGLGLVGMFTARWGLPSVITDYLPEAVEMMQFIADLNRLPNASFRPLDWREPDPTLTADWLLAADVAYEERAFEPLIDCFRQMLRPGGEVLVSEPGRWMTKGWLQELMAQGIAEQVAHYEENVPGLTQPVGVYRIPYAALQQA
jgi:predicted nicotinamide N-methyase